ncbi:MAG: septum formation protein Maf [Bacteroidetes bacterium]|nr:septum formation protein Maf [Bacteroidota bacterium]
MKKIILASGSPRRKQLLEWARIDFDIIVPPIEETIPDNTELQDVPVHIAKEKAVAVKALDVYQRYEQQIPVLAADTIVVCFGQILGKPTDRDDAIRILSMLSGKKHEVMTGVYFSNGDKEEYFTEITEVWFHTLTQQQIQFYVDEYKPYDKAGAYGIQEWIGVVGIQRIAGDFYNVMGLPVSKVIRMIENLTNR